MSWTTGHILLADEAVVEAIAGAIDPPYAALVLLLRYTELRWGEAVALRRRYCHIREGSIEVVERIVETRSGPRLRRLPGIQGWVAVRDGVREALAEHLVRFVGEDRDAMVFTRRGGGLLVRSWFEASVWRPALRAVGLPVEDMGVETLGTARLWTEIREAGEQRRALRAGSIRGGGCNGS